MAPAVIENRPARSYLIQVLASARRERGRVALLEPLAMRYAILMDGDFVLRKLPARHATAQDVAHRIDAIKAHDLLSGGDHLRTYFYHARPATGVVRNPIGGDVLDLGQTAIHNRGESLIQSLETMPDVAVRLGELTVSGWKIGDRAMKNITQTQRPLAGQDLVPNIQQKGVDLRVALDIARLSLRGLVEVLVIVTGDSDFVPACKFARREGLRVYLDAIGHGVRRELSVHVDRELQIPL